MKIHLTYLVQPQFSISNIPLISIYFQRIRILKRSKKKRKCFLKVDVTYIIIIRGLSDKKLSVLFFFPNLKKDTFLVITSTYLRKSFLAFFSFSQGSVNHKINNLRLKRDQLQLTTYQRTYSTKMKFFNFKIDILFYLQSPMGEI